uniref:Uncharacterized protein n=1 Tax=Anguilla anguilla TaxID=7936 RepID=A0A0E9SRY9_ANGAN
MLCYIMLINNQKRNSEYIQNYSIWFIWSMLNYIFASIPFMLL